MTVPENIEKLANEVRTAIHGRDVREAFASSMEATGSVSNTAEIKSEEANEIAHKINQLAFGKYLEPVDTFGDIETTYPNADEKDRVFVREDGKTYVKVDDSWQLFAEINETPINEIDSRLNGKIKETNDKLNVTNWELNSKTRQKQGLTAFTSDDGRIEEYTIAKELFESEGVPQTIYVVPAWLNTTNFLTIDQGLELQNNLKWEIGSHSETHPQPFPNISDSQAEIEFKNSKEMLLGMGFNIQGYAYPGGNYGKRERKLARKYYRFARNSDAGTHQGINNTPLNSYELKTIWVDPSAYPLSSFLSQYDKNTAIQMIIDFAKETIDYARDNNTLAIISTHFQHINDSDYQDMYREVIRYAKQNTEVTTMNEALNKMGNIVEIGDYSETGKRGEGENHYVVGVDGIVSGSLSVSENNRFTPQTPFSHFPLGVTVTPVYAALSEGAPNNRAGTLINYKPQQYSEGNGFGWQEYIVHSQGFYKFRRDVLSDSAFSEWYSSNGLDLPSYNDFDASTPYSSFGVGITVSRITSENPNITSSPEGKRGTLITLKSDVTANSPAYSHQEYHIVDSGRVYKRNVINDSQFGEWKVESGLYLSDTNSFDCTTPLTEFPDGVTYSVIESSNSNIAASPEGLSGILVTHKVTNSVYPISFNYQEYHSFSGSNMYKRRTTDSTTWGVFRKILMEVV